MLAPSCRSRSMSITCSRFASRCLPFHVNLPSAISMSNNWPEDLPPASAAAACARRTVSAFAFSTSARELAGRCCAKTGAIPRTKAATRLKPAAERRKSEGFMCWDGVNSLIHPQHACQPSNPAKILLPEHLRRNLQLGNLYLHLSGLELFELRQLLRTE